MADQDVNYESKKMNRQISPMARHKSIEVQEIASYCMVSTSTVRRWLKNGKLKSIKLPSNQYRVSIADFIDFLDYYNIPVNEDYFQHIDF